MAKSTKRFSSIIAIDLVSLCVKCPNMNIYIYTYYIVTHIKTQTHAYTFIYIYILYNIGTVGMYNIYL